MGQPDQALRQRQVFQQPRGLGQRGAIVQHFVDVGLFRGAFIARLALGLELQHFANGGLRAFDPAGQHGFLRGQGG